MRIHVKTWHMDKMQKNIQIYKTVCSHYMSYTIYFYNSQPMLNVEHASCYVHDCQYIVSEKLPFSKTIVV